MIYQGDPIVIAFAPKIAIVHTTLKFTGWAQRDRVFVSYNAELSVVKDKFKDSENFR